jgi:integrase
VDDLAQSTRYKREQITMRVLKTAGHEPVSAITEAHVIAGRERRAASPSSAQAFLDTLHGVFKWAVKSRLAKIDSPLSVKVETRPNRRGGYPPWTDDDMAKFEGRWPNGTRERVPFDILTYAGLRIGDAVSISQWRDQDRQRRDPASVVTRRGTPFNKGVLGAAFVAAARAAGVRGKSAHGLRKAAAAQAAEKGQPSGNWRPFLAGPRGRRRPSTCGAPSAAGLQQGPSAS